MFAVRPPIWQQRPLYTTLSPSSRVAAEIRKYRLHLGVFIIVFVISSFIITRRHVRHADLNVFTLTIDDVIPSDYPPLQPDVYSDFPTVARKTPRIPHIIHQTYKTTNIPSDFIPYIESFVKHNPDWTYIFWTDQSARKLIADRHPHLLQLWDNYNKNINRADALRYVVLYEFGGVYADLDFENYRPLDRVTQKYACVFPPEPFEHAVFRIKTPFLISNAIMMCRPKHPFIKQLIDHLHYYYHMVEQIDTAGPAFITSQFMIYNNITGSQAFSHKKDFQSNSPYFYKGELKEDDDNAVYVPNTRYFMDTLDTHEPSKDIYDKLCDDFINQNVITRRMCVDYKRRGFERPRSKYTFTEHHWFQSYFRKEPYSYAKSILTIVPHCKIYGDKSQINWYS